MMNFSLGPPPPYDMTQEAHDLKKQNAIETVTESSRSLIFEDLPPYKEQESPAESITGFYFLFIPVRRPWTGFFRTFLRCRWSFSASNFGFNLTHYQINYAWMMLSLVIIAILVIDSDDFNFCILWSSISVLLVYALNVSGFSPELLGRKLSLSEQLTAVVMLELPFYGLLPGAVPFIYFIVLFSAFVVVHACLTPVNKAALGISEIHHV